jgi:hypothetical protein
MLPVCLSIPIFMKLGTYSMTTEPISMVCFTNPCHQFMSLCVYPYHCLATALKMLPWQRIRKNGIVGGVTLYEVRVVCDAFPQLLVSALNVHNVE